VVSSVLFWMWCSVREREEARCRVPQSGNGATYARVRPTTSFGSCDPLRDPWTKRQQCQDQKPAAGCGSLLLEWKERRGRDENCHFLILSTRNCLPLFGLAEPRVEEGREHW